jgi:DnaJ like chaperone protein
MSLIFFCAFFGLWFGGLRGLFMGVVIGYILRAAARSVLGGSLRAAHERFVEATFAVAGAISKADGVVTRGEIEVIESLFVRLSLSDEQVLAAKSAFNRGKANGFDLDAEVDGFAQLARSSSALLHSFLQVQMLAALADGEIHPAEHQMLVRVARRLGLSERDVAQLEAMLRAAARGAAGVSDGPPPKQRANEAYAVLGVEPEATDAEIKQAYRKLIRENHPDKLASKGLPEGVRALAEERARDINAAYELLKRARNFT